MQRHIQHAGGKFQQFRGDLLQIGDLDGDREYGMADLLKLAQYVSGMEMAFDDKQLLSADVNEDDAIDIHDVIMLQQWLLVADI